jgi:hypothetical protein
LREDDIASIPELSMLKQIDFSTLGVWILQNMKLHTWRNLLENVLKKFPLDEGLSSLNQHLHHLENSHLQYSEFIPYLVTFLRNEDNQTFPSCQFLKKNVSMLIHPALLSHCLIKETETEMASVSLPSNNFMGSPFPTPYNTRRI